MAMDMDPPAWLKAMQNGGIGEARAKAFLLDRFWVLERSVDIEGADLIIQRRLTERSLFDRDAPALGVVQAKFFGNPNTVHFVNKDYVVGNNGKPRVEFFLLCFSGNDEESAIYVVSATELFEFFDLVDVNGRLKYRVSYSYLLSRKEYLISSKRLALNRMDSALKQADFEKNRRFVSWALSAADRVSDTILPVFNEPINNWWGDIPKGFKELKGNVLDAIAVIEGAHGRLVQIAEESDPLVVEGIIKELEYECRDGLGTWSIPLPDDLYSQDFFDACRIHRSMVDALRRDGLLDAFIEFKAALKRRFLAFIEEKLPIDPNVVCVIDILYTLDDFKMLSFKARLLGVSDYFGLDSQLNKFGHIEMGGRDYADVVKLNAREISLYILAGRYGFHDKNDMSLFEKYSVSEFSLYTQCMDELFAFKYGDPYR
ncbi:hypothetical protein [Pseudomonas sp.]|uniref:hypothetical protein n=1 Tax=Pseudomonas sp. TaxID=306 RepID=UPI0026DC4DE5|nr:hypothetical protein [Pseudomonas sp.]MDO4236633.1 hypothetical protein [Pseudomonas sp.]